MGNPYPLSPCSRSQSARICRGSCQKSTTVLVVFVVVVVVVVVVVMVLVLVVVVVVVTMMNMMIEGSEFRRRCMTFSPCACHSQRLPIRVA